MRIRRRLDAILASTALALSIGCGGDSVGDVIEDLLAIGIDVDIERQTVPGIPILCDELGQLLPQLSKPITIDLRGEEELQGEGVIGEFESVILKHIDLRIVDVPAGDRDDFDFVDSIRLYADVPNDTEPPVLVAELDPVPRNVTEIRIPGTRVQLRRIASRDNFTVSGEVTGRVPCDEVHFDGEADFEVELF